MLLRQLLSDPRPALDEMREGYGPVVGLGAGPMRLAVVGDPAAIRELLSMGTDPFRWQHRFNVLGFVVGPRSMIVSDGADWKRRRSAVRAGFSRRRLDGWVDTIVTQTDRRVDRILARTGGHPTVVDLYVEGRELVQEVVVRALFGAQLAERSAEIAALFQPAQDYLESSFVRQLPHPLPVGRRHRVKQDMARLRSIIDDRIAELRAVPIDDRTDQVDRLDVLGALVADATLTDDEVRDQVVSLMGAGLDTTSATLAWMLWCTGVADGDLWTALGAEADTVLTEARPYDATHLARLDLAHRVMRETTRLHPAGSFAPRLAHEDLVVAGYHIPRGTLVLWSAHLSGRDPDTWDRPMQFDPERFADLDAEQAAMADAAWVPFGGGARNCLGFALAQMELTLIVARLAQRIDIEPVDDQVPRAIGMVVNRPEGGAPMRVTPRVTRPPATPDSVSCDSPVR
jgi:cytochrome P450